MRAHIPTFVRHLVALRSPRAIATYAAIIAAFADATEGSEAPARDAVEAFLGRPRADGRLRAPATRNQELAALRAFANFALRDLGWTTNPTDGVPFAREAPRDPPVLSIFELRRLLTASAETAARGERARDLAMLAVLAQVGLRVHELVALNVTQIDLASATLVGVRGKGGTVHDLPLNAPTVALITTWLAKRASMAPNTEPALFLTRTGRRISIRSLQRLVVRLRVAIGTAKKITPHTLRHTTATLALTMGAHLSTVPELLRHADLNVTRRYLHLIDERRRQAVGRLAAAIPAELLETATATDAPASAAAPPDRTSNVGPLAGTLDAQHGLDDGARAA